MAEKKPVRRQLKKTETVRERAERKTTTAPRKRHVKRTAGVIAKPLRVVGRFVKRIAKPFAFLLIPFKTRPARFVGRILGAILLLRFFRDSWSEVRQVQWPTARETVRLTGAVFVFSIVFGVIVAITDFGLDKVFKKVFID